LAEQFTVQSSRKKDGGRELLGEIGKVRVRASFSPSVVAGRDRVCRRDPFTFYRSVTTYLFQSILFLASIRKTERCDSTILHYMPWQSWRSAMSRSPFNKNVSGAQRDIRPQLPM
jgi:hypothetical protein